MKTYSIFYSPESRVDLQIIAETVLLASQSQSITHEFVQKVIDSVESLSILPERHRYFDDNATSENGIRIFPVGKYVILYRIQNGSVEIVRVMYGGRDIDNILQMDQ